MVKKILFISLALFGLLFFEMAEECFADVSAQLEQADAYVEDENYEQAEAIYQQIVTDFPDSNDALEAQKQLTCLYIATDRQAEADAAFAELTAGFAGHEDLPPTVWNIGRAYSAADKYDKAYEIHQFNVENHPAHKRAMWSQVAIVKFYIGDGNDAAAADAAVEKLLRVFSEQATLPNKIQQVGEEYAKAKRRDKALEMWNYNVENYPKDKYAMRSQVEIIDAYIRDPNVGEAAVDAEVNKLLNVFSEQEDLAGEVYDIAGWLAKAGRPDDAIELYEYNVENYPSDADAMRSQVAIVKFYIGDGNDAAAADAAVEKLLRVFSEQEDLAGEVYDIAGRLAKAGRPDDAIELYEYNVETYPSDADAMRSQVEIIYAHIRDPNVGEAAVNAEVDKLLNGLAEQGSIAREVRQVAETFAEAGNAEKAIKLHEYNVETYPSDADAMWSQVEIIDAHIRDPNVGEAVVDAEVEKLLTVFADHPALPEAVRQIGNKYRDSANYERAIHFYQLVIDTWPDNVNAVRSKKGQAYIYANLNMHDEVDALVDDIIINSPSLATTCFLWLLGEEYYNLAVGAKRAGDAAGAVANFTRCTAIWNRVIKKEVPVRLPETAHACYFSAVGHRRFGDPAKAIEYFQETVSRWPDYQFAWNAQFLVARYFEKLARSGHIPIQDAAPLIRDACENVLTNYPECAAVGAARNMLKRWNSVN